MRMYIDMLLYLKNCAEHYNLSATLEYKYFISFSCVLFYFIFFLLLLKAIKITILVPVF